jgi:hypothetical protein
MTIYQNTIAGSGFLQGATGATGPAANTTITTYQFVATAGQSVFSGSDANSNSLTYTVNGIVVTLNGVVLKNTNEYTATNGTSITLVSAASAGDELNIYTFPAYNVANALTPAQANTIYLGLSGGTISGNVNFANGSNFSVPVGNTAQRPAANTTGLIRFNSDYGTLESANGTTWANVGSGGSGTSGSAANLTSLTGNVYISSAGGIIDSSNATGGLIIPTGTLAQRPSNAANGTIRWNTSNTQMEVYVGGNTWQSVAYSIYPVQALIVAGGGGAVYVAGGGAGGIIYANTTIIPGISYPVVVGAGGSSGGAHDVSYNGSNSSFANNSAIGGGGGEVTSTRTGYPGGSGAGTTYGPGSTGGSGTSGQGYPGGIGVDGLVSYTNGGGGGGSGGNGVNGVGTAGGAGGPGTSYSISGTATYYGGGGGGGTDQPASGASGGTGGGGPGAGGSGGVGTAGTANRGGGGGGGQATFGTGGSGIVIISYYGPQRGTGGTITTNAGYTIHTFTSSATFVG